MLQSFLCVLRLLYHLYAYYRYSGCHAKIGNFIAEKFDVPHITLKQKLLKKLLKSLKIT